MELIIKPNWSTGSLILKPGKYIPFQIGIGLTRLRFWSDQPFNINDKIRIIQVDAESRNIVRKVDGPSVGPLGYLIEVEKLEGNYTINEIREISEIDDSASYYLDGIIDLKLNLRILDIRDFKKSSTYTKTFDVPFTENNNRIFTQVFNINVEGGYNTKKKSNLVITSGGSLISSGYIQIVDIDLTNKIYKCIFYGDNINLFDDIGDNYIWGNDDNSKDIYFDDLIHNVSDTEVLAGWANEKPYIYSLLNDENNLITKKYMSILVEPFRWKIWMKTKEVIDRIFRKWGYTYTSNFLNSELFDKHLTLPSNGYTIGTDIIKWRNDNITYDIITGGNTIELQSQVIDFFGNGYNTSTGRFIIPAKGDYRISAIVNFGPVRSYKNPVVFQSDWLRIQWSIFRKGKRISIRQGPIVNGTKRIPITSSTSTGLFQFADFTTIPYVYVKDEPIYSQLEKDDEILVEVLGVVNIPYPVIPNNNTIGNPFPIEPKDFVAITSSKIGANPGPLFNRIKQIDIIGDVFKQYNLYIKPDKLNPRNFIIEPRDEFYKSGKIVDFLNYDKNGIQNINPLADITAKNWKFTYKEGDDVDNGLFQKANSGRIFGDAIVEFDNDFIEGNREIKLSAMPIMYERIFDGCILPNITGGQKTGQIRYGLYSGTQSFLDGFEANYDFPLTTGPQPKRGFYPLISNYSDGIGLGETILFSTSNNKDAKESALYYNYWENEIETYADSSSHILTISVELNSTILSKIDFNDIYWIELDGVGRYYTLLEIKEFDPSTTNMVQMDFLTYIDYRSPRPRRGRPVWVGLDQIGNQGPADLVNMRPLPWRDPDITDNSWGNYPNSSVNGGSIRGSGVVFIGDAKYPTVIGDNIILEEGLDSIFIGGTDIIVGTSADKAFIWNAEDINVDAKVISWGAVGKTHSIDNSFLFNAFNPVLDSKDQTTITQAENGTIIWNETTEDLHIRKNSDWIRISSSEKPQFKNIFDFSSGSTTPIFTPSTYEILNMTGTTGYSRGLDIDYLGGAQINWNGSTTIIKFEIITTLSANPNNTISIAVFYNNAICPCSEQSGLVGTSGVVNLATQCLVEMNNEDFIDVRVNNNVVQNIDLVNINIIISEM